MHASDHVPRSRADDDDALLEALRDLLRERDGVPEAVLADARALFTRRVRAAHTNGSEEHHR
jgi:hypothetical protein